MKWGLKRLWGGESRGNDGGRLSSWCRTTLGAVVYYWWSVWVVFSNVSRLEEVSSRLQRRREVGRGSWAGLG